VYPALATIDDRAFPLGGFTAMARLMPFKIERELEDGDIEAALRDVQTLLRCGQLMRQNPTTLVETLLAMTFEGIGLDEARRLVKNPTVSENQLRRLREFLENTPSYAATMLYVRKAEFQWIDMFLQTVEDLSPYHRLPRRPIRLFQHLFLVNQTRLDYAERARATLDAIPKFYSEGNLPYVPGKYPTLLEMFFTRNAIGNVFLEMSNIGEDFYCTTRCEIDARLAATRIIIACHLFERATGDKPQTLEELVPDFLPSVPLDPFDGKPFRYKFEEGIVYSVGAGLVDFPDDGDKLVFKIWE